jgi:hypothetical protein
MKTVEVRNQFFHSWIIKPQVNVGNGFAAVLLKTADKLYQ